MEYKYKIVRGYYQMGITLKHADGTKERSREPGFTEDWSSGLWAFIGTVDNVEVVIAMHFEIKEIITQANDYFRKLKNEVKLKK